MKKMASRKKNRIPQPDVGGVGKKKPLAQNAVKLTPFQSEKETQPLALLQEHFIHSELQPVIFEYFNLAATDVSLASTFNNWQTRATPMKPQSAGKWTAEVMLKPGRYEYRLIVDGRWQDDPMATRFATNPFRGLNSVIKVEALGI
ncbi:MAG: hypothetical protein HY298_02070 [Verrucomicrobia bacterium]|nr:hypothetical protein [Verrucomicrobiota bacterium]